MLREATQSQAGGSSLRRKPRAGGGEVSSATAARATPIQRTVNAAPSSRVSAKTFVVKRKSSSATTGASQRSIARQALLLQAQFRHEKKEWVRPSPVFAAAAPLKKARQQPQQQQPSSAAVMVVEEYGIIERLPVFCGQYTAPRTRPNPAGPAFRSTAPQRPGIRPLLCDRLTTPRSTLAVSTAPRAATALPFSSSGPRMLPVRKLLPAQHNLSYSIQSAVPAAATQSTALAGQQPRETTKKKKKVQPPPIATTLTASGTKGRLVGLMGTGPRLLPARKPVCDVLGYEDVVGGRNWLLPSHRIPSFGCGAQPQRPPLKPSIAAQLSYDHGGGGVGCRGNPMPKATSRRFVDPIPTAPPVGTYTSKFVSCGLQS
jgi:hypothetical protein